MPSGILELESLAQGLYAQSASQLLPLGTEVRLSDGRWFRYILAGAADLAPALIVQAPALVANHQGLSLPVAANIGDTSVTVTLGATLATQNQYADGYLWVDSATGIGTAYKISGHPAAALSTALTLKLKDPLTTAIASGGTNVNLAANECNGGILAALAVSTGIGGTTPGGAYLGVPLRTITAANYGWVQCRGIGPIVGTGSLLAGNPVTVSVSVQGTVDPATAYAANTQAVGRVYSLRATTKVSLINMSMP